MKSMQKVVFQDLGRIRYQEAWNLQEERLQEVVGRKLYNRDQRKAGKPLTPLFHYLLFCEHPPVYTLGKSGSLDHLLLSEAELEARGFEFFKINRGGDITYHGPGQIVGYPIFDLDEFFTDIHKYVRYLEEAVIRTLAEYGITSTREEGYTGVWLEATEEQPKRKICAIGVHLKRWVTMHGFAFNVNTDLGHFANIVPCGIADDDKAVTSMEMELGRPVDINEVKNKLKKAFASLFQYEYTTADVLH
ncbi:lipoyl(octanoyl) transferase LipB [Phaeodactylibacter sp.]|uniref:lipoyl(octanoyl) transferase LipB n=1 Tax=Phaeodactylibacter sp. TaxID=1940289 RepID=UPI0032EAFFA7